jgi:hypothetical protein
MANYVNLERKTKLHLPNLFHISYGNMAKSDSQKFDISSMWGVWSTLAGLETRNYTEHSILS